MREHLVGNEELVHRIAFVPLVFDAVEHVHGLGGGGALIEQGGIGDGQAGEVAHHGLEVEQRLQAPLRDFGLVGRILSIPARVLEYIAQDDGRGDRPRVTHANIRAVHLVQVGRLAQFIQIFVLGNGFRQGQLSIHPDGGRHRFIDELV